MKLTTDRVRRGTRARALCVGALAALPLVACGADEPYAGPQPTGVSIPPSSAPPPSTSPVPSPPASGPASKSGTDPSIAQSERIQDAAGAVAAAEATVLDSAAVEVSKDDDGAGAWEVTLRAGDNGREVHIAADGSVLSDETHRLSAAQLGDPPKMSILDALAVAERKVTDGDVIEAELTRENDRQVWDVSLDAVRGSDWELWIDASSGTVLRQERD